MAASQSKPDLACCCCRVSTVKKFPIGTMDTLRIMINKERVPFLMLSKTEQELLVDKMLQRMVSGATTCC